MTVDYTLTLVSALLDMAQALLLMAILMTMIRREKE